MKRENNLFSRMLTPKNLELAILSAAKHHRSPSHKNYKEVLWCLEHKEQVIIDLQWKLDHFGEPNVEIFPKHKVHIIHDYSSNKDRLIVKPSFRYEQIVHHAIIQVMYNMITKGMYMYNCGSIPQRGSTYGKRYLQRFIRRHPKDCKYCLKMDIHHFFQSIDHIKMMKLFEKHIKDYRFLKLLYQLIDSYHDTPGKGLPIGYYTSQWFTNWYLQGLDHYIKEELHTKFYMRYMDDMIVLGSNKRELERILVKIVDYLNNLGLHLNDKTKIFRLREHSINFMGFRFYFEKTTVNKNIMLHATRIAGRCKDKLTWIQASQLLSLLGWLQHADCYNVYLDYIKINVSIKALKKAVSDHYHLMNDRQKIYAANFINSCKNINKDNIHVLDLDTPTEKYYKNTM